MCRVSSEKAIKESRATSLEFVVLSKPVLTQIRAILSANLKVRNRGLLSKASSISRNPINLYNRLLKPI